MSAAADGDRKLFLGNHRFDAVVFLVDDHFADFCRRKCADHILGTVFGIGNNVDFFALQFGNHRLNADAAQADTGADRIDGDVFRPYRQFGFGAGIAGNAHDLDDAVINFRHFLSEQGGQKFGTGAGKENLRAFGFAADVEYVSADTVAVFEFFPRNDFVAAQHGFGFADVEYDVAELDPFDGTVNDGAHFFLVFFILAVAFGVAHFLHDHLFGGLGGNPAEVDRRQGIDDEIAGNGAFFICLSVFDRQLGHFVFHLVDHFAVAFQRNGAGFAVDLRADVVFKAVAGTGGFLNGDFHGDENVFLVDVFFAGDGVGNQNDFGSRHIFDVWHFFPR